MSLVCPHRPPCPGCPRLGADGVDPSALERLSALGAAAGAPPPRVVVGPRTAFRHRARLAVRGRAASPKIGIFETGTHRVVDIPRCLVHHPLVNDVAAELRNAIFATRTPPYSDDAHRGVVRYAQIVVARRSQTAQVVVVANDDSPDGSRPLLDRLAARLGPKLHSLFWNGNPERTNTILGPHWSKILGPDAVEETIGGARVFYPPGAFGQSNIDLADRVVETVSSWVPSGTRVTDLYAGAGPLGLELAERAAALRLNELAPDSIRGLELGVAALPDVVRARTVVLPGPASNATEWIRHSDVVIADPPRKGLDGPVRAALLEHPPAVFVYVACGLDSFLADARELAKAFELRELVVFDLFPHTEHVEVAAQFVRFAGR